MQYFTVNLIQVTSWSLVKEFRADQTETQTADVSQLRQNTHYVFRVVPVLEVQVGNPLEGRPSPISSSVRTLCGGEPLTTLHNTPFLQPLHTIYSESVYSVLLSS